MANRLSHSSVSRMQTCQESYNLHYNKRIRPKTSHAALFFGTALDRATGQLLESLNEKTAEEIFLEQWTHQEVNGISKYIPTLTTLVYAKADFDEELLTEKDWTTLKNSDLVIDKENLLILIELREKIGFEKLTEFQKQATNYAFWLVLKNKGLYMIKAFRKKVIPKLTKILVTQKKINLENDLGDSVIGYVDLVAEVENHGTVILDIKTSARSYDEETSVMYSPQLSLYVNALSDEYNTRKAGYIVLNKAIIKNRTKDCKVCGFVGTGGRAKTCDNETLQKITNKKSITEEKLYRCGGEWLETLSPDVYIQFIIDEIPEKTIDLVLENIDSINETIKTGNYNKNLNSCLNSWGQPCPYLNYCYKGDMSGLEVVGEKK